MKTYYSSTKSAPYVFLMGMLGILLSSCGASQNTTSNDGIYGGAQAANRQETNTGGNGYKEYFGSLKEDDILTDVDNYSSDYDTIARNNQGYSEGNAAWGSNAENITVNIYDNNWGYGHWNNYWYGSAWGWGGGWGWGWNNWYGPGWGVGFGWGGYPYWGGYGYGWGGYPYNYYGGGYNHHYAYNPGIRGGRRSDINSSARYSNRSSVSRYNAPSRRNNLSTIEGRRGSNSINNGFNPTRSRSYTNGSRSYTTPSNGTRSYTTPRNGGTRNSVAPARQQSNYSNQATPSRSSNYSAPSRSSSSPSYNSGGGGGRSSGGGSYGGGGRSGGGGRR